MQCDGKDIAAGNLNLIFHINSRPALVVLEQASEEVQQNLVEKVLSWTADQAQDKVWI